MEKLMEKLNSLPDLKLGVLTEKTNTVDDVLNVDSERLLDKINNYFDRNIKLDEVFNRNDTTFNDEMNSASLQAFMEMFNRFTNEEIMYALWGFLDAKLRLCCFSKAVNE